MRGRSRQHQFPSIWAQKSSHGHPALSGDKDSRQSCQPQQLPSCHQPLHGCIPACPPACIPAHSPLNGGTHMAGEPRNSLCRAEQPKLLRIPGGSHMLSGVCSVGAADTGMVAPGLCSFWDVQNGARGDPWYLRSKYQIKEGSHCHARISEMLDESCYIKNMLQAV